MDLYVFFCGWVREFYYGGNYVKGYVIDVEGVVYCYFGGIWYDYIGVFDGFYLI